MSYRPQDPKWGWVLKSANYILSLRSKPCCESLSAGYTVEIGKSQLMGRALYGSVLKFVGKR